MRRSEKAMNFNIDVTVVFCYDFNPRLLPENISKEPESII